MTKHLRGFISLLLVFVLCLGMIPSFFITEASAASTQGSILLFDFADNGDYTSRLNSQLSVSYKPNGSGTTRTAYIKIWAGTSPGITTHPMQTIPSTVLSPGAITVPVHPATPLTGTSLSTAATVLPAVMSGTLCLLPDGKPLV